MSNHYLDNTRLEELIELYQEDPDKHGNELCEMLDLLIINIYKTWKFTIDIDDAKQDCFIAVFNAIQRGNFKSSKSTAFNYFTSVISNELKTQYKKNKRYYEKIDEFTKQLFPNGPEDSTMLFYHDA